MSNLLTLQTGKYAIKLENFEGPLDLLCMLIEKNKMDIYDIKIDEITDQYLEYIKKMEQENLEVQSEFLVMASTLVYIKSKKLLPNKEEEEEELTEEELIRRIIEYKKYKDITEKLRQNFEQFSNRLYKSAEEIELPKKELDTNYEKNIISDVYAKIVTNNKEKLNKNAKNIEKIKLMDQYTVASKVKQMFKELIRHKRFVFNRMFSVKKNDKNEIVTAFSGLLELSRRNKVITTQEERFGDIVVEKNIAKKSEN